MNEESEKQIGEYIFQEINNHWLFLHNNKYSLNFKAKESIFKFLEFFSSEEIKEAMSIATAKRLTSPDDTFRYFCGIMHNMKKKSKEEFLFVNKTKEE